MRAVRSDKGNHHKWRDGRTKTAVYKLNKRNNVNWSEVRCRESTCWNTKVRKTDYKGDGAYRKNVDEGHYKGQLRRKSRIPPKRPNRLTLRERGIQRKLPRKMKTRRDGRRVALPMSQQSDAVRRSWGRL